MRLAVSVLLAGKSPVRLVLLIERSWLVFLIVLNFANERLYRPVYDSHWCSSDFSGCLSYKLKDQMPWVWIMTHLCCLWSKNIIHNWRVFMKQKTSIFSQKILYLCTSSFDYSCSCLMYAPHWFFFLWHLSTTEQTLYGLKKTSVKVI